MAILDGVETDLLALAETEIHALVQRWGKVSRRFQRKCIWLVPAIVAKGVHAKKGFSSAEEYLSRLAGASSSVVSEVVRLHAQISEYPELWNLLINDEVGWSKLRVIANSGLVTPDTAGWWAEQAKRLTKRELEDLCARTRMANERRRQAACARVASVTEFVPEVPLAPAETVPAESLVRVETALLPAQSDPAPGAREDSPDSPHPAPLAQMPLEGPGTVPLVEEPSEQRGQEDDTRRRRIPVMLSARAELQLRQLQAEAERAAGCGVSLSRVVEAVLDEIWRRGELPEKLRPAPPAVEEAPAPAPEQQAEPDVALPRRVVMEVIVVSADTGEAWMPWGGQLQPLAPKDREPAAARVLLRDLREEAVAAALEVKARRGGRRAKPDQRPKIPAAVRRYVLARSGGHCEMADCAGLSRAFHHVDRVAEGGDDHPDNVVAVCSLHHGMPHKGQIADETVPANSWETVAPGDEIRQGHADRRYAAFQKQVVPTSPPPSQ